ncbi:MAG TPA: sulfite exporter TauE/SafE family protein, partial [Spirochaetia bacterium]|nr:sulfite exporter TauE/SafE family protein [Spirochaetia bacterium]
MTVEFWYMLPAALAISTLAMASGIGGATFFSPLFILALRLPPEVAIGTALITELFGFGSGLLAYGRQRVIDYKLGLLMITATVPLAILGTILAGVVEPEILKVILGVGLAMVAISFLHSPREEEIEQLDAIAKLTAAKQSPDDCITARDGEEICYRVDRKIQGMITAGVGGLFVGLISTGLGELNDYFLLRRCKVPSRVGVSTSVFVIAVTVLAASGSHVVRFAQSGTETLLQVASIVIFTVPGVIIGGQIGPAIAKRIPDRVMELSLGILFVIVAALTI